MKTKTVILGILLVTAFFSCKDKTGSKQGIENSLEFDSIHVIKKHHYKGDPTQTSADIEILFIFPKINEGDTITTKLLANLTALYFEDTIYVSKEPKKAVDLYVENFSKLFDQTLDSYKNQASEFDGDIPTFTVSTKLKGHVFYNKNNLLSYQLERYDSKMDSIFFTQYTNKVINLKTGEIVRESDFFVEESEGELSKLFQTKLLEIYNVKSLAELDNDDFGYVNLENIVPNGNFLIDDEGITYVFNSGEYSSPKVAAIVIKLKYSEIAPLIKEGSVIQPFLPQ